MAPLSVCAGPLLPLVCLCFIQLSVHVYISQRVQTLRPLATTSYKGVGLTTAGAIIVLAEQNIQARCLGLRLSLSSRCGGLINSTKRIGAAELQPSPYMKRLAPPFAKSPVLVPKAAWPSGLRRRLQAPSRMCARWHPRTLNGKATTIWPHGRQRRARAEFF